MKLNRNKIITALILILCFTPLINSSLALFLGILASVFGIKSSLSKYKGQLLKISIVLMGFGMNLEQVVSASKSGFIYTTISVLSVMILGLMIGRVLNVDKNTSILISSGTAICGGSAIAAVSSVINAEDNQISFSLIVVFVLNAIALFIFPLIGHLFNLDQVTFGNWAAIAIHDTSSVVGAGASYGDKALEVATTVKLIRALWIIPLSLVISLFNKNSGKIQIPWFILIFVVAIMTSHFIPSGHPLFLKFNQLGKKGMVIALFFIGSGLSMENIKEAGLKSFIQGISLWLITGVISLILLT